MAEGRKELRLNYDTKLFLPLSIDTTKFTHSFDNNRFRLLWTYDDQNDKISYHLRVKTTGWVGFGFATSAPKNMLNYDVIVGGFKDGEGYLNVSYLISVFAFTI